MYLPRRSNQYFEKMWRTLDEIVNGLAGTEILGARIVHSLRFCVEDRAVACQWRNEDT